MSTLNPLIVLSKHLMMDAATHRSLRLYKHQYITPNQNSKHHLAVEFRTIPKRF